MTTGRATKLVDNPASVVIFCGTIGQDKLSEADYASRCAEAEGLVRAADLTPCYTLVAQIRAPKAATLLSAGLLEQIETALKTEHAELFYVDLDLSPVQQRNLERHLHAKVIDRTGLILEIFAARAQTQEGELQVLLARYTYQRSRLVRSWTHLERQRGGRGFLGGPGETQIEADRRAIDERIDQIKRKLDAVRKRRSGQRMRRKNAGLPLIALVGYTNAGKTTLFHRLTQTDITGEDKLFATLDPTVRKATFGLCDTLVSDTVGFIRDLPTTLIAAFRATLEEVTEADVILHIRDASDERHNEQAEAVYDVLNQLALDETMLEQRLIEVWNKIDCLDEVGRERWLPEGHVNAGTYPQVSLSALTGEGMADLAAVIEHSLEGARSHFQLKFSANDAGKCLAWLYQHTDVIKHDLNKDGIYVVDVVSTKSRVDGFYRDNNVEDNRNGNQ